MHEETKEEPQQIESEGTLDTVKEEGITSESGEASQEEVEAEVHPLEREVTKALRTSTEMFVVKHQSTETANKEPVYVVVLKTTPTNPLQAELKIKHELTTIFTHFPMSEGFQISIRSAQTKLVP